MATVNSISQQQAPGRLKEIYDEIKCLFGPPLISEQMATGQVRDIFDDIKGTFDLPFVPNLFKAMANHPACLEAIWNRLKVIMRHGKLDRKTKAFLALAVSTIIHCEYCIDAYTAVLKSMGVSSEELVEGLAVVDLFSGLNGFPQRLPGRVPSMQRITAGSN